MNIQTVDTPPVSCPDCGGELLPADNGPILTSNPPKVYYRCSDCMYGVYVRVGQPQGHMAEVAAAKAAQPTRRSTDEVWAQIQEILNANGYRMMPCGRGKKTGQMILLDDSIPDGFVVDIVVYEPKQ